MFKRLKRLWDGPYVPMYSVKLRPEAKVLSNFGSFIATDIKFNAYKDESSRTWMLCTPTHVVGIVHDSDIGWWKQTS